MKRWQRGLATFVAGSTLLVALAMVPWFGTRRSGEYVSPQSLYQSHRLPYKFPANFLFGTATAAHQIEEAQASDWTAFEEAALAAKRVSTRGPGQAEPGHIHDLDRVAEVVRKKKTNHDALFAADLAMAEGMGHNAYRFSISWARLFPKKDQTAPDPAGLAYYRALIDAIKAKRLVPFATLFHFDTPSWFWEPGPGVVGAKEARGWERADAVAHFQRFTQSVAEAFGGDIRHWCTLNEPMVYLYNGYLEGVFPPLEKRGDPAQIAEAFAQLLRAHAASYQVLKEDAKKRGQQIMVGYTQHTRAFEPLRQWAPLDRISAQMVEQAFIWDLVDAVAKGELTMTGTSYKQQIPTLAGTQDYLGLNYYGRFYIQSDVFAPTKPQVHMNDPRNPAEKKNNLGWALYPRGLNLLLTKAAARYGLPIYILENGTADAADDDVARQEFLVTHLSETWLAMQAGADVRGYFHWSLIDNFEWAEGFGARFGLVKVDFDGTSLFRRTPRPSAAVYSKIIRDGIGADLANRYGLTPADRKQ